MTHALFECSRVRAVWSLLSLDSWFYGLRHRGCLNIWIGLAGKLGDSYSCLHYCLSYLGGLE